MYISIPVTTDVADCFGLTISVPDEIFSTLASDLLNLHGGLKILIVASCTLQKD